MVNSAKFYFKGFAKTPSIYRISGIKNQGFEILSISEYKSKAEWLNAIAIDGLTWNYHNKTPFLPFCFNRKKTVTMAMLYFYILHKEKNIIFFYSNFNPEVILLLKTKKSNTNCIGFF